jgi:Recombinase
VLKDDYYVGIVTLNGVKVEGEHPALIDVGAFDRVQQRLDGHRLSGDRSHKHDRYLI